MREAKRAWTVRDQSRGDVVVARTVRRTLYPWQRLLGLLLRSSLKPGEGLWLIPCQTIHTFGMRFSIDAIFLDRDLRVVGLMEQVRPFRMGELFRTAHSVLEVEAGAIRVFGVEVGDQLFVELSA